MHTLRDLAALSGAEVSGDENCMIRGINVLRSAGEGEITFLASPAYRQFLPDTSAAAVILNKSDLSNCPTNALVADNPYLAYARISHLFVRSYPGTGIHARAIVDVEAIVDASATIGAGTVIAAGAEIGANVDIGPNCIIGRGVRIGADTRLLGNNTICDQVVMGERCLVHPGAVIGSDGFGLADDNGVWVRIAQLGTVRIGNDVDVGANTTIDRGAIGDTIIANGVKLDNMVQVSHNVEIGEHSALAGCSGIAGSGKVGAHCMLGGGAGVQGHLDIADGVIISAMTKVTRSLATPGAYTGGVPAMPHKVWQKNIARFKRLDVLAKKVKALQDQLNAMSDKFDQNNLGSKS